MERVIITNNPRVLSQYEKVIYIDSDMRDVLVKTRSLIHSGSRLVTYPLGASLRVLFSPYRSIVVDVGDGDMDLEHVEIIETSIVKYDQHMNTRNVDVKNASDYAFIDLELLKSALVESGQAVG
ncbi:MAG: GrdX family protein [Clostridium sp.]|uniref:GrdX family protein n=1 Tax=Clostridium sp. TaxID=1506 RepID=UPI002FC786F0